MVVCALRTALGCKEKQRKMVTDLLGLLYKELPATEPIQSSELSCVHDQSSFFGGATIKTMAFILGETDLLPCLEALGASSRPPFAGSGLCHTDLYLAGQTSSCFCAVYFFNNLW